MAPWATILLTLFVVLAVVLWMARLLQAHKVSAAIDGLRSHAQRQSAQPRAIQAMSDLPPPVRRYLKHALPSGYRDSVLVEVVPLAPVPGAETTP